MMQKINFFQYYFQGLMMTFNPLAAINVTEVSLSLKTKIMGLLIWVHKR